MALADLQTLIKRYHDAEGITDQDAQAQARLETGQDINDTLADYDIKKKDEDSLDQAIIDLENVLKNPEATEDDQRKVFMDYRTAWAKTRFLHLLPKAVPIPKITASFPPAILGATGHKGSFLSEGSVCVLAGAGGIAKTALTLGMAADFANAEQEADLCGNLFHAETGGGPVIFLSYEEPAPVMAWKLRQLKAYDNRGKDVLNRIHVMDMLGYPLFGPGERNGSAGLYNARPERLSGWTALERECRQVKPRLIVIDPATAAFTGDANAAGPVREFITNLSYFAREYSCGILIIAHTTKAARKQNQEHDPMDPGATGGSTHWTDAGRGCLVLDWKPAGWGGQAGDRVLAIAKSNWGPSRIWCDIAPKRHESGSILGMYQKDGSRWQAGKAPNAEKDSPQQQKTHTPKARAKTQDSELDYDNSLARPV